MKRALVPLLVVAIFVAFSCTSPKRAREALQNQGFTDIEVGGLGMTCGDNETCTRFTATTTDGRKVTGAVGCGVGCKGCTVRW